jgi:hypothetical protein
MAQIIVTYENALAIELRKTGLTVGQQVPSDVWFEGQFETAELKRKAFSNSRKGSLSWIPLATDSSK